MKHVARGDRGRSLFVESWDGRIIIDVEIFEDGERMFGEEGEGGGGQADGE
jgi:hypothetical protein